MISKPRTEIGPPALRLTVYIKPPPRPSSLSKVNKSVRRSIRKLFRMSQHELQDLGVQPRPDLLTILYDGKQPDPPEAHRETSGRAYFLQHLLNYLTPEGTLDLVHNQLTIPRAVIHKETSSPFHETVVFTINDHDGTVGYLEVQRDIGDVRVVSSSSNIISAASSRSLAVLSNKALANDTVGIRPTKPTTARGVETLLTPPNGVTARVSHVYAAMAVATRYVPEYKLLHAQCYWYAAVIGFLVTGGDTEQFKKALIEADDEEEAEAKKTNMTAGNYISVNVTSKGLVKATVEVLRGAYTTEKAVIEGLLIAKLDAQDASARRDLDVNTANQATAEERKAKEEALKAAAEERKAKEEAWKVAEEAMKKAEEAMKKADALQAELEQLRKGAIVAKAEGA